MFALRSLRVGFRCLFPGASTTPPLRPLLSLRAVSAAGAFVAFVTEGEECTLTVPEAAFDSWRLRKRATEVARGLRAVTIEASMPVDLVGFFAPVAERLAAALIPIIPQCGFRTDHILVPAGRLDDAVRVLEGMVADARKAGS